MLINGWSLALLLSAVASFFFVSLALISGVRILLFWDRSSDSEKQLEMEGRTWLAAALVESALAMQLLSLVLLIIAAENFADMIAGAMCATGSLSANEYGKGALFFKISGVFLYGFWIVIHRLDMRSEGMVLVRLKFSYLLLLFPILIFDGYYLFQYLTHLSPDIITSCCGVILSNEGIRESFLDVPLAPGKLATTLYMIAGLLLLVNMYAAQKVKENKNSIHSSLVVFWLVFFLVALAAITLFFSSYIYELPHHKCPFDILHRQYNFIGLPIYLTLFGATFLGMSGGIVQILGRFPGLAEHATSYQRFCLKYSSICLLVFLVSITVPVVLYIARGGNFSF